VSLLLILVYINKSLNSLPITTHENTDYNFLKLLSTKKCTFFVFYKLIFFNHIILVSYTVIIFLLLVLIISLTG